MPAVLAMQHLGGNAACTWDATCTLLARSTQALEPRQRLPPQTCILDMGMPDLSGYEVAAHVRVEAWGADIQLIALTRWGLKGDKWT